MAIDASIISKIPSMGPDIMGARTEGYRLADVMDQQQLSRMRLQGAQQEQQTLGQAKALAGKYDLGTTEGQQQYAAALTKLDPKLGMEALKAFTESQSGQAKLTDEQIGLYQKKHDILDGALQPMAIAIEDAHKRGMPPAQIEASLMPAFSQTLKTLQEQKLPNGEAILNKDDIKMVSGWLQPGEGNLLRGITGAIASSKTNAKFFADRQKAQGEMQTPQTLMGPDGKQHRYLVNKATGEKQDLGPIGSPPARAPAAGAGGAGGFSGAVSDLQAAMADLGVTLPAGFRSKEQQLGLLKGLINRHAGMTSDQIAQGLKEGILGFRGEQKAIDTAGNIAGRIRFAEQELLQTIPLALEASDAIDRGKFVPFNKLRQLTDTKMSDPALKTLKVYMTSLSNAYDVLSARGGTDAEKRAHNREMFDTADSPEALRAALMAVQKETEIAGRAAEASMRPRGAPTPPSGSAAAPGTPPPGQTSSPGTGQAATSGITETTNEAQYNALPKGAKYRMPGDATIRVKQ
jgi:hypothetical protein